MSKLEKFVDLIINEENEEATRALHDWIVEQARNIHQELIAEDDDSLDDEFLTDSEDFDIGAAEDEIESEEVYAEDEEEDELDLGDAESDLEGDLDLDAEVDGEEAADLEFGDDEFAGDEEEVADDLSMDFGDELANLEAELAELKAKFDDIQDEEGDDEDEDSSEDEDEVEDADSEEEFEFEAGDDEVADDEDSIEESWATDLAKVAEPTKAEVASVNKKSTLPAKNVEARLSGEPVKIKGKEHKGFERETAPSSQVKTGSKKPTNSLGKSDEKNKEV